MSYSAVANRHQPQAGGGEGAYSFATGEGREGPCSFEVRRCHAVIGHASFPARSTRKGGWGLTVSLCAIVTQRGCGFVLFVRLRLFAERREMEAGGCHRRRDRLGWRPLVSSLMRRGGLPAPAAAAAFDAGVSMVGHVFP